MNAQADVPARALQRFAPDPDATYSIDAAAHLAQVPRHLILLCCKHGLIEPRQDPVYGGYYFDAASLRTLKRVGYLHSECGINFKGIRIILGLMDEVDRLRATRE